MSPGGGQVIGGELLQRVFDKAKAGDIWLALDESRVLRIVARDVKEKPTR
jgi:hypothetical protein